MRAASTGLQSSRRVRCGWDLQGPLGDEGRKRCQEPFRSLARLRAHRSLTERRRTRCAGGQHRSARGERGVADLRLSSHGHVAAPSGTFGRLGAFETQVNLPSAACRAPSSRALGATARRGCASSTGWPPMRAPRVSSCRSRKRPSSSIPQNPRDPVDAGPWSSRASTGGPWTRSPFRRSATCSPSATGCARPTCGLSNRT
jgi:hypothetical protein